MNDTTPSRADLPPPAPASGEHPARDDLGPLGTPAAGTAIIVKPVVNAIRILRYLSQTGQPTRAIQIARHLSINSSTCFNILRTLVAEGVVEFSPLSKTYLTGLGLVKLAQNTLTEGQRFSVVKPLMHDLAARYGVSVALWKRIGLDRILLVALEHSPSDLRIHMTEGQRLPLMMGASGRTIAPYVGFDRTQLRAMFKTLRWQRPITFEDYWRQVEETRARGFSIDDGYFARGILSIAAPVRDPTTDAVDFSMSVVMFQGQYDDAGLAEVGRELCAMTPRLSALLF
jgi:DNA-binding IclR family transcriptional regulator